MDRVDNSANCADLYTKENDYERQGAKNEQKRLEAIFYGNSNEKPPEE